MAIKKSIQREDASVLRPKKVKPFDADKFIKLSLQLQKLIKKEEKIYGPLDDNLRFS